MIRFREVALEFGRTIANRVPWLLVASLAIVPGNLAIPTAAQSATEYQVKAAFLYNFAKFVEWPQGAFATGSSLHICVLGEDPFGADLAAITTGKLVDGHAIELKYPAGVEEARTCHVLFISKSERSDFKTIVQALQKYSVLTVGDSSGFLDQGGMINFVLHDDRVQFEVNPKVAESVGLKISSKLLGVARVVKD
jgi:hypothetical protein